MFETHILEAVAERDIDLLILEELIVSQEFAQWFYLENHLALPSQNNAKAFHSVSDAELGESDIVVLYENGHAILVENKIDATVQEKQALRYILRGEKGLSRGYWTSYSTCIMAPDSYLESVADVQNYQATISYESIRDWFEAHDSVRYQFKKYMIQEAIEQNRRGYKAIPDALVTSFWKDYWNYSIRNYPDLRMAQPGKKPANASFINLYPESLPKTYQLLHKVVHGFVDLQIPSLGPKIDKVTALLSDMEIEIAQAGKSLVFRKQVPKMDISRPFRDQEHIADMALHEALELAGITQEV
ncbi:MAG: hypothetical protein EOM68_25340, partial [Spirochaetia bacterium]|nr:hypothetical protein [Spirochaetia bacterium]